jgi:hypothetical protein
MGEVPVGHDGDGTKVTDPKLRATILLGYFIAIFFTMATTSLRSLSLRLPE